MFSRFFTKKARGDSHIAIKAFVKSRPDELSLSIGDFVYVEESDGMGWMRGTCKTRTGWFPSSHVQRYKGASNDADKESEETEGNNDIVPRTVPARHVPRSVEQSNAPQSNEQGDTEVGERKSLAGDAEEEDMYQDIGALSGCATPQITTSTSSTTSSGTSSLTTPAVSPRTLPRAPSFSQSLNASPMVPAGNDVHRKQEGIEYRAVFDYVSKGENELWFKSGMTVRVIESPTRGWWRGKCDNRTGWFPKSYVQPVTVAESPHSACPIPRKGSIPVGSPALLSPSFRQIGSTKNALDTPSLRPRSKSALTCGRIKSSASSSLSTTRIERLPHSVPAKVKNAERVTDSPESTNNMVCQSVATPAEGDVNGVTPQASIVEQHTGEQIECPVPWRGGSQRTSLGVQSRTSSIAGSSVHSVGAATTIDDDKENYLDLAGMPGLAGHVRPSSSVDRPAANSEDEYLDVSAMSSISKPGQARTMSASDLQNDENEDEYLDLHEIARAASDLSEGESDDDYLDLDKVAAITSRSRPPSSSDMNVGEVEDDYLDLETLPGLMARSQLNSHNNPNTDQNEESYMDLSVFPDIVTSQKLASALSEGTGLVNPSAFDDEIDELSLALKEDNYLDIRDVAASMATPQPLHVNQSNTPGATSTSLAMEGPAAGSENELEYLDISEMSSLRKKSSFDSAYKVVADSDDEQEYLDLSEMSSLRKASCDHTCNTSRQSNVDPAAVDGEDAVGDNEEGYLDIRSNKPSVSSASMGEALNADEDIETEYGDYLDITDMSRESYGNGSCGSAFSHTGHSTSHMSPLEMIHPVPENDEDVYCDLSEANATVAVRRADALGGSSKSKISVNSDSDPVVRPPLPPASNLSLVADGSSGGTKGKGSDSRSVQKVIAKQEKEKERARKEAEKREKEEKVREAKELDKQRKEETRKRKKERKKTSSSTSEGKSFFRKGIKKTSSGSDKGKA